MTTIYLIRHGEISSSSPRRYIGSTDLRLTARGRDQAVRLGAYLASRSIGKIVCSPLARCRESAAILGSYIGCEPEIVPDLAEIDLGCWEGLTVQEVQQRYPGSYEERGRDLEGFRPPGGESFVDLLSRVWPAFTSIVAPASDSLAVVSHAGVNRVLLCHLLGMPLGNLFRLGQGYGCHNILHGDRGDYWVERINICL